MQKPKPQLGSSSNNNRGSPSSVVKRKMVGSLNQRKEGDFSPEDDSESLVYKAVKSRLGATSRLFVENDDNNDDNNDNNDNSSNKSHKSSSASTNIGDDSIDDSSIGGSSNGRDLFVLPVSGARGLHLQDIEHVLILSPPKTMDEYLHMAGRTGRAGNKVKTGTVISLVSYDELKRMQSWQTNLGVQFEVEYE